MADRSVLRRLVQKQQEVRGLHAPDSVTRIALCAVS